MAEIKRDIDNRKIETAIQSELPLTVTTYTLPTETEEHITEILNEFLKRLDKEQMSDAFSYCVRELVNNSKKANIKRIYFAEKGFNINDPDDYEMGMKTFKQDTFSNIDYYSEELKKKGLYVKITFQVKDGEIKIEIRNNSELTVFEEKRIKEKLEYAKEISSIENGAMQLLDESEGAGLGLIIMTMLLQKYGLSQENFLIFSREGETINRIHIPLSSEITENIASISKEFVSIIDNLPEFPENIAQIISLINSPDSNLNDIARKIYNDVSLTTEILKTVNSAIYAMPSLCISINDAVKFIGLRGIKNLLLSIGAMENLFIESNEKNKRLWSHSYRVGFYSYNIAKNFCKEMIGNSALEDTYTCGLLHDIGKIVFENAHPEILDNINRICDERKIPRSLFESLVAGGNHGEIGALIAEKWNFPEVLIQVIRYHHKPTQAPQNIKRIAEIVYLADALTHYSEKTIDFDQINEAVLADFGIKTEKQLENIAEKLFISFNTRITF